MMARSGASVTDTDREEIAKFSQWISLESSRRAGGEPHVLNMAEQVLYPEGIGRAPADGPVEA